MEVFANSSPSFDDSSLIEREIETLNKLQPTKTEFGWNIKRVRKHTIDKTFIIDQLMQFDDGCNVYETNLDEQLENCNGKDRLSDEDGTSSRSESPDSLVEKILDEAVQANESETPFRICEETDTDGYKFLDNNNVNSWQRMKATVEVRPPAAAAAALPSFRRKGSGSAPDGRRKAVIEKGTQEAEFYNFLHSQCSLTSSSRGTYSIDDTVSETSARAILQVIPTKPVVVDKSPEDVFEEILESLDNSAAEEDDMNVLPVRASIACRPMTSRNQDDNFNFQEGHSNVQDGHSNFQDGIAIVHDGDLRIANNNQCRDSPDMLTSDIKAYESDEDDGNDATYEENDVTINGRLSLIKLTKLIHDLKLMAGDFIVDSTEELNDGDYELDVDSVLDEGIVPGEESLPGVASVPGEVSAPGVAPVPGKDSLPGLAPVQCEDSVPGDISGPTTVIHKDFVRELAHLLDVTSVPGEGSVSGEDSVPCENFVPGAASVMDKYFVQDETHILNKTFVSGGTEPSVEAEAITEDETAVLGKAPVSVEASVPVETPVPFEAYVPVEASVLGEASVPIPVPVEDFIPVEAPIPGEASVPVEAETVTSQLISLEPSNVASHDNDCIGVTGSKINALESCISDDATDYDVARDKTVCLKPEVNKTRICPLSQETILSDEVITQKIVLRIISPGKKRSGSEVSLRHQQPRPPFRELRLHRVIRIPDALPAAGSLSSVGTTGSDVIVRSLTADAQRSLKEKSERAVIDQERVVESHGTETVNDSTVQVRKVDTVKVLRVPASAGYQIQDVNDLLKSISHAILEDVERSQIKSNIRVTCDAVQKKSQPSVECEKDVTLLHSTILDV